MIMHTLLPFIIIIPAGVYCLISWFCARKYFRRTATSTARPATEPGVTILKPVKGMDADSYINFASFCHQDFSGPLQLLFAVAYPDDPVISVIQQLIEDYPAHDITLTVNPAIHGPNYKVSNLINACHQARHDIIIVCDSDIRVTPGYLTSVTGHFCDPRIGLVTSLYRTSAVHGTATALEATGFTAEMIPNVLVALQLEGLSFALGASMAVRREALTSIGGFESLADYLADDYQLGNKIHHAGWGIALDDCFVESIMKAEDLMTVLSRQLRWARTMRVSRPGGYLASGITLPFPAALGAALLAPTVLTGITAIALLYSVRMTVSTIFSRRFVRDDLFPRWLWLLPLRDMLAFFCWSLSFSGNRIEWRGTRFRLKPGGKLEEMI